MKRSSQPHRKQLPRAWVTFVDTGAAAVIRDSHKVSSVTRNGTGNYTITWSRQFGYADAATGYAFVGSCRVGAAVGAVQITPLDGATGSYTNGFVTIITGTVGAAATNTDLAMVGAWGP